MVAFTSHASITRKDFVTGAALGSVGALGAASLAGVATAQADETQGTAIDWEQGIEWAAEYDVVVLGSGIAGFTAAITAAELGSRVLVLEKAPLAGRGGDSRFAANAYIGYYAENRDAFISYITGVVGDYDTPDASIIEAFADYLVDVPQWLNDRGGNIMVYGESTGAYQQYEGWDAVNTYSQNARVWDAGTYNVLATYIETLDNVDVWYSAPATELVQNPETKVVCGVVATIDGTEYPVRALNGVVVCTGGFVANQQMVQDYLHLPEAFPKGSTYDTGDGINLTAAVGATMWHMANSDGPDLDVVNPLTGMSHAGGAIRMRGVSSFPECSGFMLGSAIFVGADGTRFCNEAYMPDHGFENFHGRWIITPLSLPAYAIFDQAGFATPIYPVWGTNDEALADGTIVQAATLDELTEMLGLPEGSLAQSVATYNDYCAAGLDAEFGRDPQYLTALSEEGPYYAVEVKATYPNTMGGPRHNAAAEIVDYQGNPIPHLYGAGECGSMWGDTYPGGGNIAECLAFGRIAGENAAAEKADNFRDTLMGDREPVDFTEEMPHFEAESENEYVGMAPGIGGPIWISVTMEGDTISGVEILHNYETPGIGSRAIEQMPARFVEANSADVDDVTGATSTSEAIKDAVRNALAQAGVVTDDAANDNATGEAETTEAQ